MRNSTIGVIVLFAGLIGSQANAMPMGAPAVSAVSTDVVRVDWACGPGWHRTPWGECAPGDWRRGPPRRDWDDRPPPPRFHHRWGDDRGGDDNWHRPPPRW